ncbi:MAG: type II secretion system F family protein [Limisphaerales bacterium]
MPTYRFTAVDEQGRSLRGELEAASERALEGILRKQGRWLAAAQETRVRTRSRLVPRRRGNARVPRQVLVQFFLSVGLQLRAGVNLFTALSFGLERGAHAGFAGVHAELLEQVKAGAPLSEAMAAHPRTFSTLAMNLVRAGEASGRLAESCEEIRKQYEWSERLAGDVRQALLYPAIVMVAISCFFVVVFTFFIPRFSVVLKELGVPLPLLTRAMIGLSDFLKVYFAPIGLLVFGGVIAIVLGMRLSPAFARWLDHVKLRLPVFGPILWQICLSRLVQNLATLYRAGIPLLVALGLCRRLVGNRVVEQGVATVQEGVRAGRPLHETMAQSTVFPPLVVQMTALGESTGSLAESLQNAADYYNVIVPRAVKKLFSLLEPVMIVTLLLLVGVVALSVLLPIASALEAR